jgi:hypothetical protein
LLNFSSQVVISYDHWHFVHVTLIVCVKKWFPWRTQLLSLDATWLLLIAAVIAVFILWLKVSRVSVLFSRCAWGFQGLANEIVADFNRIFVEKSPRGLLY